MDNICAEWKELKPQIGNLLCRIDNEVLKLNNMGEREKDLVKMFKLMKPESKMIIFSMARKFYEMDCPD